MPTDTRDRLAPLPAIMAGLLAAAAVCGSALAEDDAPPAWLTADLGGLTATVGIATVNAYAQPSTQLATNELRLFTFGNRVFNTNWVAAPASVDRFDGLGPVYNRVSCSGCHTRDGRGRPPSTPSAPLESMLMRISLPGTDAHGGPKPVPGYGDQLNEKALLGVPAEARTIVRYEERAGHYPDGTPYTLTAPIYAFRDLAFGPLPSDVQLSPRAAPPVFGLGLLEAVPEQDILTASDPNDADGDGISGRPNYVWNVETGRRTLGRFGWKANQPSLRQQSAAAALGDIGLTNRLYPLENVAEGQAEAAETANRATEPDLADEFLDRLTFYLRVLAVPAARNVGDPRIRQGAKLFERIRCTACHLPTLKTGSSPDVPLLSWQTIHPFTDLLLHDMGEALADGRPDYEADGREWRTPPLWGIGLTATVNGHTRFLHDGRARSLEEAILWHGGEAVRSRESFMRLDKADREALLKFLANL